tara:strand:+ start:245 stop:463 length:219 start_codon:yes stop_codon:yes gene_type:complete
MPTRVKNTGCTHHWKIEVANGPMSNGACTNCGEERSFQNSIFTEAHHITLDKERGDAENEKTSRSWNRWLND